MNLEKIDFEQEFKTKNKMDVNSYAEWIIHKHESLNVECDIHSFIDILSKAELLPYTKQLVQMAINIKYQEMIDDFINKIDLKNVANFKRVSKKETISSQFAQLYTRQS